MSTHWINRTSVRQAALSGVVVSSLLGLGASGLPAAQAAAPAALQQMMRAIAAAHSYAGVVTINRSGASGATSTQVAMVVIRAHGALRFDVTVTETRAQSRVTTEIVDTGAHLCARKGANAPWACGPALSSVPASAFLAMAPDHIARAMGLFGPAFPSGTMLVQGQRCLGYSVTERVSGGTVHGTYCLDPAHLWPVEMSTDTVGAPSAGQPPVRAAMRSIWSHWNDPTLTIPAVPAP